MMQQFMQGGGMGAGFPFAGGAGFGAPPAASAPAPAAPVAPVAPALSQAELKQKYASEIQQLKDMGFCN